MRSADFGERDVMNLPVVNCRHWSDCGKSGAGCCAINYRQQPSYGVCRHCDRRLPIEGWTGPADGIAPARPAARRTQAVPRDQWPLAVRVIARLAKPDERGIGQTLTRLIGMAGGEQYKRLMKRIGVDCGCAARAANLDAMYPLEPPSPL
jgi:hypothetical protein